MPAHDPDRLVLVLRLEDQDAAQHLLRLGERAVDGRGLAALPADRRRGRGVLEREAAGEVALRIQLLVEVGAGLDHRLLLPGAQAAPGLLVERAEADELHALISMTGRTSVEPSRAPGMREASWIASLRSRACSR